jgi:hypothetical protein
MIGCSAVHSFAESICGVFAFCDDDNPAGIAVEPVVAKGKAAPAAKSGAQGFIGNGDSNMSGRIGGVTAA